MKKTVLALFITVVCFSCISDDDLPKYETQIVGKWKLIEQLLDPGDGSGTFQPISSNRVIEFFNDGTLEINGVLCFISLEVGEKESGIYMFNTDSNTDFQYDGEIISNSCSSRFIKVYFDLPVSGNLIISYQCIESCSQKFKKLR